MVAIRHNSAGFTLDEADFDFAFVVICRDHCIDLWPRMNLPTSWPMMPVRIRLAVFGVIRH